MAPKKPAAATTLRQLHGVASSKATFIRSDARALESRRQPRGPQLKGAFTSFLRFELVLFRYTAQP